MFSAFTHPNLFVVKLTDVWRTQDFNYVIFEVKLEVYRYVLPLFVLFLLSTADRGVWNSSLLRCKFCALFTQFAWNRWGKILDLWQVANLVGIVVCSIVLMTSSEKVKEEMTYDADVDELRRVQNTTAIIFLVVFACYLIVNVLLLIGAILVN